MKIKTSELTGAALDWAVWAALGTQGPIYQQIDHTNARHVQSFHDMRASHNPQACWSESWAQGGPIIEREGIDTRKLIAQKFHRYEYSDKRLSELGGVVEVRHSPRGPLRWLVTPCKPHPLDGKFLARKSDGTGSTVMWSKEDYLSDTALIAAMRCFVASKLGDEVDIPEELCHG